MKDDLQTYIEPELEARLVALILGEASAFEVEELERLMEERSEVRACKERLESVHGVLVEAHRNQDDSEWRLSDDRRSKILSKVEQKTGGDEKRKAEERVRRALAGRKLFLSMAACLMLGMIVLVTYRFQRTFSAKSEADLAVLDRSDSMLLEDARADFDLRYQEVVSNYNVGGNEGLPKQLSVGDDEKKQRHFAYWGEEPPPVPGADSPFETLKNDSGDGTVAFRSASGRSEVKLDEQSTELFSIVPNSGPESVSKPVGYGMVAPAGGQPLDVAGALANLESNMLPAPTARPEPIPAASESRVTRNRRSGGLGGRKGAVAVNGLADLPAIPGQASVEGFGATAAAGKEASKALADAEGLLPPVMEEPELEKEAEVREEAADFSTRLSKRPAVVAGIEMTDGAQPPSPPVATTAPAPARKLGDRQAGQGKFTEDSRRFSESAEGEEVALGDAFGLPAEAASDEGVRWDFELADAGDGVVPSFGFAEDGAALERGRTRNGPSQPASGGVALDALAGEESEWFAKTDANGRDKDGLRLGRETDLKSSNGSLSRDFIPARGGIGGGGGGSKFGNLRGLGERWQDENDSVSGKDVAGNGGAEFDDSPMDDADPFMAPEEDELAADQGAGDVLLLEQEMLRRQKTVTKSIELADEAKAAKAEDKLEKAVEKSREALALLPEGVATKEKRKELQEQLVDESLELAQKFQRTGRYEEAREMLEEVEEVAPGTVDGKKSLEYLDDPIRTNPSLTFEHTDKIDQIRRDLYKGEGFYDLGLYDKATEEFKKVLRTDPYNKAARRWMERTSAIKSDYYRAAYDQTRAEMLMEVDRAWELGVPPREGTKEQAAADDPFGEVDGDGMADADPFAAPDDADAPADPEVAELSAEAIDAIPLYEDDLGAELSRVSKLKQIVIPEVDFKNTTVEEAIEFLELRSRELDNTTLDEDKKGVDFRLRKPRVVESGGEELSGPDLSETTIEELKLKNVPLETAMQYVADMAKLRYRVDDHGVTFLPLSSGEAEDIVQRKWEVDPGLVGWLEKQGTAGGNVQSLLQEWGVDFSPGSSVSLLKDENLLIMRSTPTQLELLDGIVGAYEEERQKEEEARKAAEKRLQERQNFESQTVTKSDSTFSLNVSDVSFKLAKASLAEGKRPEIAKIRPEEFFNALEYGDERPSQAEKVACAFEQSAHPFMPQRNLMRVSMSTASLGRNAATPLRLTLILDQSGSMEREDRAESVQRAFALLAEQLTPNDEVTLIGFARTPRLLAERVKGDEADKLAAIVANPITEGGTNLEQALSSGMQLAKQQYLKGAQNRIILLTDGAANLGDARPETLARQVESMRRAGIAFDACGVGADGLNDEILSSLTKEGDGRYYFLDRPEDADDGFARQIAGALRPAAKNVKVQVLFNRDRVKSFYLYGFEKHQLKKEDFRNDAVDAAEMAAEESGVALYHFEALPGGRGPVGTISVRFLDTASNEMVERTWTIPYNSEAAFFNDGDPKLRLASIAGLFAEKLRESPVGERVEAKRLRQELEMLKPRFESQPRFQELQTMLRQAGD